MPNDAKKYVGEHKTRQVTVKIPVNVTNSINSLTESAGSKKMHIFCRSPKL